MDGEGEHTAHPAKTLDPPTGEGMQDHFGIAVSRQVVAQFRGDFTVIVNFAVVGDGPIAEAERLPATTGIDNGETAVGQTDRPKGDYAATVRATMRLSIDHVCQSTFVYGTPVEINNAGDSTHLDRS